MGHLSFRHAKGGEGVKSFQPFKGGGGGGMNNFTPSRGQGHN